jgi:SAM-dependent methyltransferase
MKKANKQWADKFSMMLSGRETVLDVGCSTGHFINLVKDKAEKIYGHELNRKEIQFCRNVLNLDVSDQPLETRFKPGTFDFITLIYVLEHIAAPHDFLASLAKLLKPGGKFVILVPNVQDALVNFYNIPEFVSFYYCIEHLYYYSPATIKRLFDGIGLGGGIEVIQEYPITNHLNWAYLRAPSDTLAARLGVPNVALQDQAPVEAWSKLWQHFNLQYQTFLKENGYGDRIWCVVGPEHRAAN